MTSESGYCKSMRDVLPFVGQKIAIMDKLQNIPGPIRSKTTQQQDIFDYIQDKTILNAMTLV